ncbi:peroxisome membrane protein [Syncephalastrum racemosum]|uniref:Peroxisomal membrane protein PEX16 n=1 Tax=Syncephalastrum racemosum TaxID=13706 RepID=A0A1X2HIG2_SYNRA|nr:peroxisome membrane protein [Syncephalastrum racemosum]
MLPATLLRVSTQYRRYYATQIELTEDLLRALALALPGRFEDADLCSQSILSVLNLVSLFNTHLLARRRGRLVKEQGEVGKDPFSFNDHIRRFYYRRPWPRLAAASLSIVSYTEVVFELFWRRRHDKAQSNWRWIAIIETIKACLRFFLFYNSQRSTVLHPAHLVRNIAPDSLDLNTTDKLELGMIDPRTGTPSSADPDLLDEKIRPVAPRSGWAHAAEILWIIRPVIYALLVLQRVQQSQMDSDEEDEKAEEDAWKPWLVSLGIDLMARVARYMQPMSPLEKEESRRRDFLLLYYFFRGPIYTRFTKNILDTFCDTFEHRPIVSIVAAALNDYRVFWEQSYFYTAGS